VVVFVALLMTVAVFALVSYPLLRPGRSRGDLIATNHRGAEDLLAQRDAAYAAIKELEFEFHLGNLSQGDYEDLRARYRQRAADILRRLDAAEREAAAAHKKARGAKPSRDGGAAEEIERAVALLRQQREGKTPATSVGRASRRGRAARARCSSCNGSVQPGDRFCGHCGARLSDRQRRQGSQQR
jgi:hypothetical protein